jgi:hypothetical protein
MMMTRDGLKSLAKKPRTCGVDSVLRAMVTS